jgi:hypothetical protein
MPLPKRGEKETKEEFMARCMSNDKVREEFPNQQQRVAVCMSSAGYSAIEAADAAYNHETYGFTEEINEDNFYVPAEAEYEDFGEATEEWDVSEAKPGLWENIRKKKEREGKDYRPAQPGDPDRPTPDQIKRAQSASCPAATQDIELNTKNRNETIEDHMYGPLNPDEPGDYWEKIADMWDTTEEAAKQSLCGNCVAFDISQRMNECMPGEVSDESGRLGYCWMHHFKCHSARTCETWAKGGPITSNEMSEKWSEKAQALQYGRPSKNDPRKTPAPKKDQKRGSKKNKPDSAKDEKGKITFSKETIAKLEKKVKEHNEKDKGSKATLGMLKAVYRRGAGAYSASHAPKMSRDGWAIARVNAFLYLLRNGRPSNPNYKQDNDLLPKSHPRSSKAEESSAVEYQGKKVKLNKPFRTPKGPKKFSVYVKNDKGNVVKVNFGDPNMDIKRDDPARRKSFRARHQCDTNPGPKWKARYWSCKFWEAGSPVSKLT